MTRCADNIQTPDAADTVGLAGDLRFVFGFEFRINASRLKDFFVIGLGKACRFGDEFFRHAFHFAHIGFRQVFGVTA